MVSFETAWQKLLQEIELARHYADFYLLIGLPTIRVSHPILERSLPTLLLVNLMSLFDEAMTAHIESHCPGSGARTLEKRIDYLSAAGALAGRAEDLHALRRRRNVVAHETGEAVTWAELSAGVAAIGRELAQLGAIHQDLEPCAWFAERSGAEASPDPQALFQQRYAFGLKQGGRIVVQFGFTNKILKSGQG